MTCNNPFEYLEVHGRDRAFMCCPCWLPIKLRMDNIKKGTVTKIFVTAGDEFGNLLTEPLIINE